MQKTSKRTDRYDDDYIDDNSKTNTDIELWFAPQI